MFLSFPLADLKTTRRVNPDRSEAEWLRNGLLNTSPCFGFPEFLSINQLVAIPPFD